MARHVVISCDGHAGGPGNGGLNPGGWQALTSYYDPQHRGEYEEFLTAAVRRLHEQQRAYEERADASRDDRSIETFRARGRLDPRWIQTFEDREVVRSGGGRGLFDSKTRLADLEAEGVVAEVLFPNAIPFAGKRGTGNAEMRLASEHAYNRWLVDFCAEAPGRRVGVADIGLHDVEDSIAQARAAKAAGLGGVVVPAGWWNAGIEPYCDERYEPFWAVCQELNLPVHFHASGGGIGDEGAYEASRMVIPSQKIFAGTRVFPFLVWGGVFERYPDLGFVFTESSGEWPIEALRRLDMLYTRERYRYIHDTVKHSPSEYFRRQVFVAASMMDRFVAEHRHDIGLDNLMWGSDYPHYEGTWPDTQRWLVSAFGELPATEVATMLTTNPVKVYGFDLALLEPIAARIGPDADELAATPSTENLWEW